MMQTLASSDRYGTARVLKRLFGEYVRRHWMIYSVVMLLMAVVAACTALTAYLIGNVINQAYVYRDFGAIVALCAVTFVLFTVKGIASYGQAVTLAWVSNRIVAENQRRMLGTLLQEGIGYCADRPSTEVTA